MLNACLFATVCTYLGRYITESSRVIVRNHLLILPAWLYCCGASHVTRPCRVSPLRFISDRVIFRQPEGKSIDERKDHLLLLLLLQVQCLANKSIAMLLTSSLLAL